MSLWCGFLLRAIFKQPVRYTFITTCFMSSNNIFIDMIYLVFFTVYCFTALVCANLVGKSLGRFGFFDLISTYIDAITWSIQVFLATLLLTGGLSFSKMQVNLTQYRGTAEVFNRRHFALELKLKSLLLLSNSQNDIFPHCVFFFRNTVPLFLFLTLFLILNVNWNQTHTHVYIA